MLAQKAVANQSEQHIPDLVNTVRARNDTESRTFNIRLLQRGRVGSDFWHASMISRRLLECFHESLVSLRLIVSRIELDLIS